MTLIDLGDLSTTLDLGDHEHVAVVGGGGKTTIVHALGDQLGGTRILTTTTKMGFDQHRDLPVRVLNNESAAEARDLTVDGQAVVVWGRIDEPVALGVQPTDCDRWFPAVDHVIVEADGARRRPFKAPAPYEPVVPHTATLVVSTIGADALDHPIEDRCHRPELVAGLAGCSASDRLTPDRAARVLLHADGNRRSLPPGARLAIVVTKVDAAASSAVDELLSMLTGRAPDVGRAAIRHSGR